MKRLIYILSLLLLMGTTSFAQDQPGNGARIQERMREYLQSKLSLSKSEADKFAPVFLNYFNELRQTNQQFKGDLLVRQQKLADLRLRYREQFKPIMGDKKSNDMFVYEREFIDEVKHLRQERLQNHIENNRAGGKRF